VIFIMERDRNSQKNSITGIVFFAIGIACFLLAGLIMYIFSGKFVNVPSGMKAGPALSLSSSSAPSRETPLPPPASHSSTGETPSAEAKQWVLYITGEVVSPGVYRLPSESRVFQLVEAAGGLTSKADPVQINLASPLEDGVHVHVPAVRPLFSVPDASGEGAPSFPSPPSSSPGSFLRTPSLSFSSGRGGAISPEASVNVNSATATELQKLPGIGPAIARAILEYRQSNGRFSSVEELLKVKGIGAKKLEAIRGAVSLR